MAEMDAAFVALVKRSLAARQRATSDTPPETRDLVDAPTSAVGIAYPRWRLAALKAQIGAADDRPLSAAPSPAHPWPHDWRHPRHAREPRPNEADETAARPAGRLRRSGP